MRGRAAVYLRLTEADVLRLAAEQGLPAQRLGQEWRFLKSAIERWPSQPHRMTVSALTTYWILPRPPYGPLGFGVAAWSPEDALRIIHALGYGDFLPDDLSTLTVREGIKVVDLDHNHVVLNVGPIAVRGMWYPFLTVGMPKWAEDRMRQS